MATGSGGLTVGELFAGIGGFGLGLERAGFTVRWQVETDPVCRAILKKNFPHAQQLRNVRWITGEPVDVLCGGFPCQDLSWAGRGEGLSGARSGLWWEFARLIGEARPRYVIVENVTGLLKRGFGVVLGDLAALGYDAEWDCIPACAAGAPHERDRLWVVAYSNGEGRDARSGYEEEGARLGRGRPDHGAQDWTPLADSDGTWGRPRWWLQLPQGSEGEGHRRTHPPEPMLPRVDDGIPFRVDRNRALGNALVPQIAEWIGRRILSYEHSC